MNIQDEEVEGQAEFWQLTLAFIDSLVLRCAVELGITDLIKANNGEPVTLTQIVASLMSPPPDTIAVTNHALPH
ncbi:hypothetical protein AMTR_s00003p00247330 [Amborella trichopoda]|uniref:O-methyltransferase dimerisation domain-containing protein n=1 Tax=Amborella trichopoda TaxID=13333 RepID=W1P6R5_AMBTC|nr:hypothetical protein AMTR_s00003p00247330 [Amborella trichopoda]